MKVPILVVLPILASIVAVAVGIIRVKRLEFDLRLLLGFLIFGLVNGGITFVFMRNEWNTLIFFHVYTLIEFTLIMAVFSLWKADGLKKVHFHIIIIAYLLFWVASKFFVENLTSFDTYTSTTAALILAIASLYMIYEQIVKNIAGFSRQARFWVAMAVFIYCSTNVALWALSNIIASGELFQQEIAWTIHFLTDFVTYIFYTKGFLCPTIP